MKKILVILIILISLSGCNILGKNNNTELDANDRYLNLIEIIKQNDTYTTKSNNFDISAEMAKIDGGYRFYVTIDNPRTAMYDVEAIAIEDDVDYGTTMAANIGIFDENQYNMIPNQSNPDRGYVKVVVISSTTQKDETRLYVLVQWKRSDLSTTYREIFSIDVSYLG